MADDGRTRDPGALRGLTLAASCLAVLGYPLVALFPPALLVLFTVPLVLATTGRLRGHRRRDPAALGLAIALLVAVLLGLGPAVELFLALGPLLAVTLATTALRPSVGPLAIAWAASAVAALGLGLVLVAASPAAAVGLGALLLTPATAFVASRLRRG